MRYGLSQSGEGEGECEGCVGVGERGGRACVEWSGGLRRVGNLGLMDVDASLDLRNRDAGSRHVAAKL